VCLLPGCSLLQYLCLCVVVYYCVCLLLQYLLQMCAALLKNKPVQSKCFRSIYKFFRNDWAAPLFTTAIFCRDAPAHHAGIRPLRREGSECGVVQRGAQDGANGIPTIVLVHKKAVPIAVRRQTASRLHTKLPHPALGRCPGTEASSLQL
jgi:hypothetical protein